MEISSRQYKRYILSGGDVAALPVGSMEVMGPHLPVGSKHFIAKAVAEALCRHHKGLCLPPVPLSPIYGKKELGGLSMDHQTIIDYVTDAVCEAHDNGIRRMLLVSYYCELYYVVAEIFQEHDIPLVHVDLNHLPIFKGFDKHQSYNAMTAGSLYLLGEKALLEKMLAANENCLQKGGYRAPDDEQPIKGIINVTESEWCSGILPHFYNENEYKVLPTENIDAKKAADEIDKWAKGQDASMAAYASYSQVFNRAAFNRGMRMGDVGYEK